MRRYLIALALLPIFTPLAKATTITAISCNLGDVQTAVASTVNGDTVIIPAGTCTWTGSTGVVVTGKGITIIGTGSPNSSASVMGAGTTSTILIDSMTSGSMFTLRPSFGNATMRLSSLDLRNTLPRTGYGSPIGFQGTCTSSGCPNVRVDNIIARSSWSGIGISDDTFIDIANVFGVLDHNTIGDVSSSSNGLVLANVGFGHWKGVGSWGDNSWSDADTFGTTQSLFLENNVFNFAIGTDTDTFADYAGGARFVCRFNTFNSISSTGVCSGHGTDTTGRPRGVRQWEAYWNTGTCSSTSTGCPSTWPGRSGVGRSFANVFTNINGGFLTGLSNTDAQRRWRPSGVYGACDGSAPWDTNDGGVSPTIYFSGTVGAVSNPGSGVITVTDSGTPGWTTNQWATAGAPFSFHDLSRTSSFSMDSNTSNQLVSQFLCPSCIGAPQVGDSYQIRRATVCMDQPTRSGGQLLTGNSSTPVLVSTGLPGPVNQTLDPTYEADDILPATANGRTTIGTSAGTLYYRDLYVETVNQAANSSTTTPFNGANGRGSGHGVLANRPATCTTGAGYWATDQGTWNTFDSTKKGVLYVCTSTNVWTLSYTPAPYPHPLIGGGGIVPPPPPNAPTGLNGSVSGSTVSLNWTSPIVPPVLTAYTLYRGSVHGGPYSVVSSGLTSTSTTDTPPNGTWFYTVTAYAGGIITSIVGNGTTATVTCNTSCSFPSGATLTVGGNSVSGFNGIFTSTGQPTGSSFTFSSATNATGSGGGAWQNSSESAKSNEVQVTVPAVLTVSLLPSTRTFASQTVGTTSASQSVTLTNTSAAGSTVTISSKTITGANAGDYAQSNNCPSLLLSGTSCTFNITFSPTAAGARVATLAVADNAAGNPQTVALSGTGVAQTPGVSLNPTSLNFGDQTLSTTSTVRSIILTNTGSGVLTITSVVASGDFAVVTVPVTNCGGTMASLATCSLNVTFTPTATGGRTGAVTVTDNAAGSPHVATLSGNGITTKCQMTATVTLSGLGSVCQ